MKKYRRNTLTFIIIYVYILILACARKTKSRLLSMNASKLIIAFFSVIIGMFASQLYIAIMMYMDDDKKAIYFFHKFFAVLVIVSVGTLVYTIFMMAINIQHIANKTKKDS